MQRRGKLAERSYGTSRRCDIKVRGICYLFGYPDYAVNFAFVTIYDPGCILERARRRRCGCGSQRATDREANAVTRSSSFDLNAGDLLFEVYDLEGGVNLGWDA